MAPRQPVFEHIAYKIWYRRLNEPEGRTAVFSHKDDAENYLNALKDCGATACLREIPTASPPV